MAIDNLGRDTGGSLPISALAQGLSKDVSEVMESSDTQSGNRLESLLQATNRVADVVGDNLSASSRAAGSYAQQIIQTFQNIYRKESKQESRGQKEQLTFSKNSVDLISKIYKMGKSPKTFWVGLGHFHPTAVGQMQKILKDCGLCKSGAGDASEIARKAIARRQTGSGGSNVGEDIANALGGGAGSSGGVMSSGNSGLLKISTMITGTATFLSAAASQLSKAFGVDVMGVFDGLLADSNSFRMQLRDIIYQTRGFGDENRLIEASYRDIGGVVEATGVMRGKIQTMLLSNIKRGLAMENATTEAGLDQNKIMKKRLVETKRTMSVGIHAAKQLGMNVEGMNSMFMDWRMHLGMGVFEIAQMGRGMHEVARATGLSGAELEKAVKATDQIMKKMKSAGRLSAESAKSVMGMMAAAQKYGVGDQMGKMMEALSSGKGFRDATDQMKVMLIQAAQLSGDAGLATKVKFGQASSPKDMAKVSGGLKTLMTDTIGSFGIDDKFVKEQLGIAGGFDLTNLSEVIQEMENSGFGEQAYALSNHLEKRFEMGIGEIEQMAKSLKEGEEAARPYEQRMADLTQELTKMEKAGMGGTDAFKELQARISETNTNALQTGFEEWAKAVNRSGGDLVAAQTDLSSRLEGTMGAGMADQFAGNLSESADKLLANMNDRAKRNDKNLGKMFSDRGFTEAQIKDMLVGGTKDQINDAMMVMGEVEESLKVADRTGQDPITDIQNKVVQINNRLGEITDGYLFGMSETFMKILFWVGTAGGFLASILGILTTGLAAAQFMPKALTQSIGGLMGRAGMTAGSKIGRAGMGKALLTAGSKIGSILSKAMGPLTIAFGALTGAVEADTKGRTKTEGALLGALTGGAGTGSMFSGMLGIEKGSGGDKALGVAGSAAWGASIGLLLAPLTAGISIPVAAAIGAGVELIKIITEGTTILSDLVSGLISPITFVLDMIWGVFSGVGKVLKGIFTLDLEKIVKGIFDIFLSPVKAMYNMIASILKGLWAIPRFLGTLISGIGGALLSGLKSVFIDFPMWLVGSISSGITSLLSVDWLQPIFAPFEELWTIVKDTANSIIEPFSAAWKVVQTAWEDLTKAFEPITKIFTDVSESGNLLTGALKMVAHVIGFVLQVALFPLKLALQGIALVIKGIMMFVTPVLEFFSGLVVLLSEFIGGLANIGGSIGTIILDGLTSAFVDFPAWLLETITDGIGNVGTWMYEMITGAMATLGEWILDMIPGLRGATETKEDFIKTRAESGDSFTHGVGGIVGGAASLDMGKTWEGTKEMGSAVLSAINPLNWFDAGSREIDQTGVAVVHQGEMIVPKTVWEQVMASGENFIGGGMIKDAFSAILNPFSAIGNVVSGVGGGLANSFFGTSQSDEQTKEQHDKKSLYDYLKIAVDFLSKISMSSNAIAQNLGAFSPEASSDALAKGVSEKVSGSISSNLETALGTKESSDKKSTMAELGKSLYYEMGNITNTVMNVMTNPISAVSSLVDWIGGSSASAETSAGNGLDYKEQIKGQVSTVGMTMAEIERRAAQEKASAEGGGSSTAIGMSGVEGILHEEVALMQMMYETLVSIKENTTGKTGTKVIGPKGGNPAPHSTGVKSIARDYARGYWDFQTNDMSPPAVTNDGRGGN